MTTRDDDDEQEPMFESLDAMCAAYGWDDAIKERIRLEMEPTRPRGRGDTLH